LARGRVSKKMSCPVLLKTGKKQECFTFNHHLAHSLNQPLIQHQSSQQAAWRPSGQRGYFTWLSGLMSRWIDRADWTGHTRNVIVVHFRPFVAAKLDQGVAGYRAYGGGGGDEGRSFLALNSFSTTIFLAESSRKTPRTRATIPEQAIKFRIQEALTKASNAAGTLSATRMRTTFPLTKLGASKMRCASGSATRRSNDFLCDQKQLRKRSLIIGAHLRLGRRLHAHVEREQLSFVVWKQSLTAFLTNLPNEGLVAFARFVVIRLNAQMEIEHSA